MIDPLDLLKLFAASASPAESDGLPGDELRFVLESEQPLDLSALDRRIAELLDARFHVLEGFEDPALDRFAILRFPGVERTLPSRELYEIGYALCDALALQSVEPDIGAAVFDEADGPRPTDFEAARVVDALCWVNVPEPTDHYWALKTARFDRAWQVSEGAGTLVAQPDSGIAPHAELEPGMFRLDLARNILSGDSDPTDPLREGAANPGHGSGTASVLAGRRSGRLIGAAPRAHVVPIRCLEDVKIFDAAPVTRAILYATAIGSDVISLSLGGIPSRAMHEAVKAAVAKDIIIVAAAGNCVRTVVWPARYDEVIAVAGSNIDDRPWKGSSRGSAIDITAPAELVWRAARNKTSDPLDLIGGGQGTSFAAALTAGAAALWVAAHGRAAIVGEARRRGVPVQYLFRSALKHSARRPAGWDTDDFGPGILDAEALVRGTLGAIPAGGLEAAALRREPVARFIDEEFGFAPSPAGFDWARYQAEIATIALIQARLGYAPANLAAESKWSGTRPSAALNRAVRAVGDERLSRFGEGAGESAVARPPAGAPAVISRLEVVLPSAVRGALESAIGSSGNPDSSAARAAAHAKLETLDALLAQGGRKAIDAELFAGAEEVLDGFARGAMPQTSRQKIGLEALILLHGRPALRVRGNTLDLRDPRAAEWHDRLILALSSGVIEAHFRRIGRIDVDHAHVGTGFVVGDGLVLTNRHVLQEFAAPIPRRNNPTRWEMTSDAVTIDFADRPSSTTLASKYRITGVFSSGPNEIDYGLIDLGLLDAALLHVEVVSLSGELLPKPGCLVEARDLVDLRQRILVAGYPAQPSSLPLAASGDIDMDVVARLGEIFGADFGTKYAAPGEVMSVLGAHPQDSDARVFSHDATTLVGNSGSAIIALGAPQEFVGLHFGGQWRRENYAHGLSALRGWSGLEASGVRWCAPQ